MWAIEGMSGGAPGPGPGPAVLDAYDATNILTMLYSSAQNATRDSAGNAVKFWFPLLPTVSSMSTSTEVDVYGLVGTNPSPHISSIAPSSATAGETAFTLTLTGTGFVTGDGQFWYESRNYSLVRHKLPDRCDDSGNRHLHSRNGECNGHESSRRWHIERSDFHHQ